MSRLDYQRTVVGYHGCDLSIAEKVLLGGARLKVSHNDYDWLGAGVYFWEYGPERARQWATEVSKRRSSHIKTPAVIGGLIHLGVCFDLLDVKFTTYLSQIFPFFVRAMEEQGTPLPKNEALPGASRDLILRKLDCAMLNWAIPFVEAETGQKFHTVRCAFQEGEAAYRGSAIMAKSHIQIVVRDFDAILGYFKPETDA